MPGGKTVKSEWNTNIFMGSEINLTDKTTAAGDGTGFFPRRGDEGDEKLYNVSK